VFGRFIKVQAGYYNQTDAFTFIKNLNFVKTRKNSKNKISIKWIIN